MATVQRRTTWKLIVVAAAVLLAAIDTYVVVLALPSMMRDVDISVDQLQQATPIISGFLLGYITTLPTLGRLSDLYGRYRLFLICIAIFCLGSVITASGHELLPVVIGRTLQGLGGGGLVPITLAMVADMWPPRTRGVPLGVIGAVQEIGSIVGPMYGAAIISISSWRTIFWLNIPLAAVIVGALALTTPRTARPTRQTATHFDFVGIGLVIVFFAALISAIIAPLFLTNDVLFGQLYAPFAQRTPFDGLTTPLAFITYVSAIALIVWGITAPHNVRVILRTARVLPALRHIDIVGNLLLIGTLSSVVIAFATADPAQQLVSSDATFLLPTAIVLAVLFVVHERRTINPLVHFPDFSHPAALGALATNFFLGAALMTALVNIPLFARVTIYPDSQLGAAFVLVRFFVAVPIGALIGGMLCQRLGNRVVATTGMALSAAMFGTMTLWNASSLNTTWSTVELSLCGLGFGLAIAPINAAMLDGVKESVHGLASALVVVTRMIGMLIGLSVLTAIGLNRFYTEQARLPSPQTLCPGHPLSCSSFDTLVTNNVVAEFHTLFAGAALCALIAAVYATTLLRRPNEPLPS